MTITLELTREQERDVLQSAERQDEAAMREVLAQALEKAIRDLLHGKASDESEGFDRLADRLAEGFASVSNHRPLPAEALTRESLYGNDS